MASTMTYLIGAEVSGSDGVCAMVTRVVVNLVAGMVTHWVIRPTRRHTDDRLIHDELADGA